jgi:superfamily II DNA or RNA helicase
VPWSPGVSAPLSLVLTPHGHLVATAEAEAPPLDDGLAGRLARAFARGSGHGLLRLGAAEVGQALPPAWAWWRALGARYVAAVCTRPDGAVPAPAAADLDALAANAPLMTGAEYLTGEVLAALWREVDGAFAAEREASGLVLADFVRRLDPAWNLVGRVHFNLAENPKDRDAPFAFLATYSERLSARGTAQHRPLGEAVRAYAGAPDRLLSLLGPVQRAAQGCGWLAEMVEAGEIYHPLRWSAGEALRLLQEVPALERAGVVVRMPATWKAGRPARPQVTATVGKKPPAGLGADALLDFRVELTIDGERLTAAEARALLAGTGGLALLRGRWVEVDRERLGRTLDRFREAEQLARDRGLGFAEAMRMLAGAAVADDATEADAGWSRVVAGPWLAETLRGLRSPAGLAQVDPGPALRGSLRPYQQVGVRWLHLLTRLGLGACLADDMGLGKTIQVLSLLLVQRGAGPSLLVAPASLLANWAAELERFAPALRVLVAHPSAMTAAELGAITSETLADIDLVITSYGALLRVPWLAATAWHLVVLDEAQAIKNPGARQTRAAKQLRARARIALTGTPVENRLGDLWSLFDFLNPGLLGTAKQFTAYTRKMTGYGPLRELVRPYLLRRLKTDRTVIADLPDKTEVKAYCGLGRRQAALYQEAVDDLAGQLAGADGIARRGVVLASLVRLKQICNHPSHWLGDGAWAEADSGKWTRLRELVEVVAARQEKALVFTQFRELTAPLAGFLGAVFGRPGLVLHGGTPVRQRKALVARFQDDESVPFFVLSLKAGGTGLNLTAASHVIHVDRWWNPAVEDQATDRAFRIGQQRNVVVHKLVCRGTVEEKIDALIEDKKRLGRELLEGGAELNLTELGDDELLRLVALDLEAATKE